MTRLRVAVVQAMSRNGEPEANLAGATPLVRKAIAGGAEVVVCPEFLATGYLYAETTWSVAEKRGGRTEAWLVGLASSAVVGAGWLESHEGHFYNTFTLAGPTGILGRVRKMSTPACEGRLFAPDDGPKVVQTSVGRIGIGICNDNHLSAFFNRIRTEQVDLLLMPHSAPVTPIPGLRGPLRRAVPTVAQHYAHALGVPTLAANKANGGRWWMPIPPLHGLRIPMAFEGGSCIVDADGTVCAKLADEVGVAMATVQPSLAHRTNASEGYFAYPQRGARLWRLLSRMGQHAYARNGRRSAAAEAVPGPPRAP
jgi:N-carbamoylputrescine amidase